MTATEEAFGLRNAVGELNGTHSWPCSPRLRIESRIAGGVAHVFVDGELDIATDDALRDALASATERTIHLDLSGVAFMGCSTLTMLFEAAAKHDALGQRFSICAASSAARRLLDATSLHSLIVS